MKTALALIITILSLAPAYGRVGENVSELTERYGEPSKRKSDSLLEYVTFLKGGVAVNCVLKDGRTVAILYDFFREVTPDESTKLLEANGAGLKWKEDRDSVFKRSWIRSDSKVTAIISKGAPNVLMISENGFLQREGQKSMHQEQKNLEGF